MTTLYSTLEGMLQSAAASESPYVQQMRATVEDSGWHREASVWVHTEMVTNEFLKIWKESGRSLDDREMFHAGVAALFHDFGKPDAEDERVNKEGVKYRRYSGHEAISASEFRAVATSPDAWKTLFGVEHHFADPHDIFKIGLMIQHHLPYAYQDGLRRDILMTIKWSIDEGDIFPFFALLRADARGRISDDHEAKLAAVEEWIESAEAMMSTPTSIKDIERVGYGTIDRFAYVLIGPSGAGKSTFLERFGDVDIEFFSQDALRLELYGDNSITDPVAHYHAAWKASTEDKDFRGHVTKRVQNVVKSAASIVVSDNMNLGKKARREFISAARQSKRVIVGVVFASVGEDELISRGAARNNRGIPPDRLREMFRQMYLPAFDEVDLICVV